MTADDHPVQLTPAETAMVDPVAWAVLYRIRLQSGELSFVGREYQVEPMQSVARRRCYMKATQLGVTEFETVLKTLHDLIHGRLRIGAMVLFPTTDDVVDFSKSRFNPIIDANKEAIGRYVKAGGKGGTDTAGLKKVGRGFLYLRGAGLTQGTAMGERESGKLRSAPVDSVKFEEMDLIGENVIEKARGRMGNSDVAEEVFISNPTLPDYGIDRVFALSDQRHWHKRCGCGVWTSPEETFPECVGVRADGTGFIKCPKCGGDIGPLSGVAGQWVPKAPANTAYMVGYRMSQLMSPAKSNDPAEILEAYRNPPDGNLSDVVRLRLGLPHASAEDRLAPGVVRECCGGDPILAAHKGPCAMGVDVGKVKHVLIGGRVGAERYQVFWMGRVLGWNDLHDLAKRFNVRSSVVDARPYEDEARAFQKAEPYRVWLCEYTETSIADVSYNDASGIVKANRTQAFDQSHRMLAERRIVLPRRCPEVDVFVTQCGNAAKKLEVNKRSGTPIYRYVAIGPASEGDHYRNALNYFLLAASGSRLGTVRTAWAPDDEQDAVTDYDMTGIR